jgi:ABC-2 type transport system ATP-binding protein
VGYVPEQHFFYPWMTVAEVIGFVRPFYPTWDDPLCGRLLARLELDRGRRVEALSRGSVVKLALLLALAHGPELLLMDEPTSGLDPLVREEFLDGLSEVVSERPRTILFSSHNIADVERVADSVGIIHDGQLVVSGPLDRMLRGTKRLRVTLAEGASPGPPPVGTVRHWTERRDWMIAVAGFAPGVVEEVRSNPGVERVEVSDMGLEEILKCYIKARRGGPSDPSSSRTTAS